MTIKPESDQNLQAERTAKGHFAPGTSGNPQGKPKGTRNHATRVALELMENQLEQITQTLIAAAVDGDMTAIRLVMEKLIPPCKERTLPPLELPAVVDASSLPRLTAAILKTVATGELMPSEANAIASLVGSHGKALELVDLETRLTALEQHHEYQSKN